MFKVRVGYFKWKVKKINSDTMEDIRFSENLK